MSVELLEIPDDTQALPRWLESQLGEPNWLRW